MRWFRSSRVTIGAVFAVAYGDRDLHSIRVPRVVGALSLNGPLVDQIIVPAFHCRTGFFRCMHELVAWLTRNTELRKPG